MRHRIDPLIAERAPWLCNDSFATRFVRRALDRVLGYERTIALATVLQHLPPDQIMQVMAGRLARRVEVSGLHHIPQQGPALVVVNHPTGIADGIILHHVLAPLRPDLFFFANSDVLRVLPQMARLIAPVEWRSDKRSREKTRETLRYTQRAVQADRLGVIFPSGRLAKRRGLRLEERPWMTSAATLARKYRLPVVPIHLAARNSALFYLFDAVHPTLRDITLFHETLNKDRQPFSVTVGAPIAPEHLPSDPEAATEVLKRITLDLPRRARTVTQTGPAWRPATGELDLPGSG